MTTYQETTKEPRIYTFLTQKDQQRSPRRLLLTRWGRILNASTNNREKNSLAIYIDYRDGISSAGSLVLTNRRSIEKLLKDFSAETEIGLIGETVITYHIGKQLIGISTL